VIVRDADVQEAREDSNALRILLERVSWCVDDQGGEAMVTIGDGVSTGWGLGGWRFKSSRPDQGNQHG
jgi:hypothetical protein